MKAVCVLEAILRKKDEENFPIVVSYFSENTDVLISCSESPQASLREKSNKVRFFLIDVFVTLSLSLCVPFLFGKKK